MIIGLTGGSGTGKSSVCDFFRDRGFVIIDLDAVSRSVCQKGKACTRELARAFGSEVLDGGGCLRRRFLGDIVFGDRKKLEILNSITHKYIIEETEKLLAKNRGKDIVLDAPLLFESGLNTLCTLTVCILSKREIRTERIMRRDGLSRAQAEARIDSQPEDEFYISRCDEVFENNSGIKELEQLLKSRFGGGND